MLAAPAQANASPSTGIRGAPGGRRGLSSPIVNRRRAKKTSGRLVGAARAGDVPALRRLLRAGARVDAPDRYGTTALYAACVQGAAPAVRALLDAGASPSLESGSGDEGTPLCAAACWGYADVVAELLRYGADPAQREDGGHGLSPLAWADRCGHEHVAELLGGGPTAGAARARPRPSCAHGTEPAH